MTKLWAVLALAVLAFPVRAGAEPRLRLTYTSGTAGEIDPCG